MTEKKIDNKKAEEIWKKQGSKRCPHCGACLECGHVPVPSNPYPYYPLPYYPLPYYPLPYYPYFWPQWVNPYENWHPIYPIWATSSDAINNSIDLVSNSSFSLLDTITVSDNTWTLSNTT